MTAALEFPPAQLKLDGTTWTRSNPGSQTSAVYQCPGHPGFHITLILATPLKNTLCTQVHATPNLVTFKDLHLWLHGGNNFHPGAEHFKDLSKPLQNTAYNWYLANSGTMQALLTSAHSRLRNAKDAAFPDAPAAAAKSQAPEKQAAAWEGAQQKAETAAKQHASAEQELQKQLHRVRKLLNYVALTFPDATEKAGILHFICDYAQWSVPLAEAVAVWAPPKNEVPQSKFKAMLSEHGVSGLFFLHGALAGKGRVAWAVPRVLCKYSDLDAPGDDSALQEIAWQRKKLDHVVANVIEPEGYASGHVFLPFIGSLVEKPGWYSYEPGHTCGDALTTAIEFKLRTNRLPRCIVETAGTFCAFELMHFVHGTNLTKEQTGFLAESVPEAALATWAEALPEGKYDIKEKTVLIDGLVFALGDEKVTPEPRTAYGKFGMPAYFLRQTGKKAYFDMTGLHQVGTGQPSEESEENVPRATHDTERGLLIWADKSTFPLPKAVLASLDDVPKPIPPGKCVRIVSDTDKKGTVFYLRDLYDATPRCTALQPLGELYVLETSNGIRLATHVLRRCESSDDVMVMGGDGIIGWVDLTLTRPLVDHLETWELIVTGCKKLAEFSSGGKTWWKVAVQGAEVWVSTLHVQQVVSADDLQMYHWVLEADGDVLVFIKDGNGEWMARLSDFSSDAPAGHM